jgi:hypothetical protein
MKTATWIVLSVAVGWAGETFAESPVTRHGTSVLHYMARTDFSTTETGSNVVGALRLQFNEQGHSQKQSLTLVFAGLETNASYDLTAVVGDDTNVVVVSPLAADARGRLRVAYRANGLSLPGHGWKSPLPPTLDPLTGLQALGLDNAATQTVALVWIANAPRFQYLVKRNLTPEDTNGTAAGSISLIANPRHVNFRLLAGGLNPTNDYHLALNSNVVSSVQASETGRLQLREWPSNAPPVLELRQLQLLDASSNVVLSTTLPR